MRLCRRSTISVVEFQGVSQGNSQPTQNRDAGIFGSNFCHWCLVSSLHASLSKTILPSPGFEPSSLRANLLKVWINHCYYLNTQYCQFSDAQVLIYNIQFGQFLDAQIQPDSASEARSTNFSKSVWGGERSDQMVSNSKVLEAGPAAHPSARGHSTQDFWTRVNILQVGIWIANIWRTETSEYRTFRTLVFRSSVSQMPSAYYLLGKKIVDKLSAIHITQRPALLTLTLHQQKK